MSASAAMIREVRRMTDETASTSTYTDSDITTYIERYPVPDRWGYQPYLLMPTGVYQGSQYWESTYDLHRAASDIWGEKAAALAPNYNMSADGASLSRSEAYDHAMAMSKYHLSRRVHGVHTMQPDPRSPNLDDESGLDE